MEAKVTLDHIINKDELLKVYRTFCQCYEIELDKNDERRFIALQYNALIHGAGIDHRPFMGSKFFGKKCGNEYSFHGYNDGLERNIDVEFKIKLETLFKTN